MQENLPEELKYGDPIFASSVPKVQLRDVSELLETAKLLSKDSDCRVFHRFEKLRVFNILRLQRCLAKMTSDLEELVASIPNIGQGSGTYASKESRLNELIQNIESTLSDYDNALWAQERIERFRVPESGFVTAFRRILETQAPLINSDLEADSRFHLNTLLATPKEAKSWVHRFIDSRPFLGRRFGAKSKGEGPRGMIIYSEQKIRRADQIFTSITFCLLILCPVIVLSLVDNTVAKLLIVVGFFLFSATLLALGTASNNSSLAVLAAYAAFLVFFLGAAGGPS